MPDPLTLARSVDLGPRPPIHVHGAVRLTATEMRGILQGDHDLLVTGGGALPPAWADAVAALSRGLRGRWTLGPLEVLDAGEGGLWLVASADDDVVLAPTSSRALWRLLCSAEAVA